VYSYELPDERRSELHLEVPWQLFEVLLLLLLMLARYSAACEVFSVLATQPLALQHACAPI
jgi:hypothetical protein